MFDPHSNYKVAVTPLRLWAQSALQTRDIHVKLVVGLFRAFRFANVDRMVEIVEYQLSTELVFLTKAVNDDAELKINE